VTDTPEFPDTEEVTGSNPVRPTRLFETLSSAGTPNGSQAPAGLSYKCWSWRWHEPPCVGATLLRRELALTAIGLAAGGVVTPDSVHREIGNARTDVRDAAGQAHAAMARRARPRQLNPPHALPALRPTRQVAVGRRPLATAKSSEPTCKPYGLRLDPILARIGPHIGC